MRYAIRTSVGVSLALGVAVGLGFVLGDAGLTRERSLHAAPVRGDRAGDGSVALTATVLTTRQPGGLLGQTELRSIDALYILDYAGAKLRASVLQPRTTGAARIATAQGTVTTRGEPKTRILNPFVSRDLIEDFGLKPGSSPQFLMTTGTFGQGWEPVLVIETTTGQVNAYRLDPGGQFELIQRGSWSDEAEIQARGALSGTEADPLGRPIR